MRWSHLLFGLLLGLYVKAEDAANATSAESSSAEKTEELLEEENVLVLHQKNFDTALKTYKYLLVEFYAPWCGHCQELAPKYSQAAATLKEKTSEARLAKVDATEEKELSDEIGVSGYPTLKLFQNGNRTGHIDYGGRRDTEGLVRWMLRRMEPAAAVVETVSAAEELIKAHENTVIGFFKDPEDADLKLFNEVASNTVDFTFGVAHKQEIFDKFGVTGDSVVFFKSPDGKYEYQGDEELGFDKDELVKFLMVNTMDLVVEYNDQTSEKIFAAKIPNHLLLFINKTVDDQLQLLENFRQAAPDFKGKILFVVIDSAGPHAGVLEYFGLTNEDIPTIRLINIDQVKKFAFKADKITAETVKEFCQGVLDGQIKQNLLSEEIPEDWDKKPVKVLVGKNFEEVAYDETKNVFVEFYAPWCTHCKELEPIWEELGEKYKDHENVVIAKIDGTANEIDGLRVRGYPNLRFFPAGPERKMIEYTKNRTVDLFSKFLDSGGVLPQDEEEKIIEDLKAGQNDIKVEDVIPEKSKDEL
ncbi:protein disulfide-isomerase A2 [Anomaloglossus baeobatrachus]|uniref:protein disulfide-isomerase A2 n=1 Tax=Anomaloglossus baeobatrachus TaxID=238106 RepID=UPI003F5086A5